MKIFTGVRRRWPVAAVAALAMAATAVHAPAAADEKAGKEPAAAPITLDGVKPGKHEITLITGDKVTLTDEGGRYRFEAKAAPRPGHALPTFHGQGGPDGFYVYPDDVLPAIAAGRVDRALFDVKYLAEHGYADDTYTPVIVQYPGKAGNRGAAADALPAGTPTATLDSINGAALAVPHDRTAAFWSAVLGGTPEARTAGTLGAGLAKVWLDRKVEADLDRSVPLVGAPQAWAAGLDGAGVKVAVLDTGIDDTHPDLAGKVAEARSFVDGVETVKDGHGHGTHVASTITGSGAASDGRQKGVAPGAELAVGKVLDDNGDGQWSDVIEGMQWAATSGAKVVNMSLGGGPTDGADPLSQALDNLTAETGALFVVAAGNAGQAESVGTPGAARSALTVAATDKDDKLAGFSSRGPRTDGALKPDIAAPGAEIVAARAAGTSMGTPTGEAYTSANGTSMATPHVAGAAAILAQRHPDWTAAQLKTALMSTAKDVGLTVYERGSGRLDLANAVTQRLHAATANLDYGYVEAGAAPVSKELAYVNASDQPVTLTLTPALATTAGEAVPAGVLTVDGTLTIAPGQTGTATVTLSPADLPIGAYTGAVTATDDRGTRLTVPVGLLREPPKVKLTMRFLDREGAPVDPKILSVIDVTGDRGNLAGRARAESPGVISVMVPQGVYSVTSDLSWIDPVTYVPSTAWLVNPEVEVAGDTEVTLDGRELREIRFDTPKRAVSSPESQTYTHVQQTMKNGVSWWSYTSSAPFYQHWITPTKRLTRSKLLFTTSWGLALPEVTMEVRGRDPLKLNPAVWPHAGKIARGAPMEQVPFTGDLKAKLVNVGVGENLAGLDLRGRLALLDDGGDCGGRVEIFRRIRDAGAAGVLMWPSAPFGSCGFGPLIPQPVYAEQGDTSTEVGIPYVTVAPAEAKELIRRLAKGPVTITVKGTPKSPYAYQLHPVERDRIPASMTYKITDRRLAAIDTHYHSGTPMDYESSSWPVAKDQRNVYSAYLPIVRAPDRRTEYVGPIDPEVVVVRQTSSEERNLLRTMHVFDKPGRLTQRWNAGPFTPGAFTASEPVRRAADGQGLGFCPICRQGDVLWAPYTLIGPPGQFGDTYIGGARLFRDGTEIPAGDTGGLPSFVLPKEAGDYRLTLDDPGNRTTAEWTFRSRSVTEDATQGLHCLGALFGITDPCRPEQVVFVSYDLTDSIGLDNSVPAGRRHTFGARVYHSPTTGRVPAVSGLKLWTSTDDGASWTPADVRRGRDGVYTVSVTYPRLSATKGAVSLRAEAWNAAGDRVTQTSLRAFTLR
ncbi:S8 family peptidase [Nonomuraea harbinensis]|uniref:S8 family serine peptidase n=1 Tax=Nonomuraea harbinensis TaxID=1286938 RepID=A0ABW1BRD0_9ACTN|nr:S8 family serine peptidase [Nonomuraea harbinensis]